MQSRTVYHYHYRSCRDDRALTQRIREIAETRIRYGVQRIHILLRREGWRINHKKPHRIYCLEGLSRWAYENRVTMDFSRPRKPTDNGLVESFNGSLLDECLRALVPVTGRCSGEDRDWRQEYNQYRPHSSLNNQTPAEFIRSLQTGPDLLFILAPILGRDYSHCISSMVETICGRPRIGHGGSSGCTAITTPDSCATGTMALRNSAICSRSLALSMPS